MKFHILTDLKDFAWGGGNQFQKALKQYLISKNIYVEEICDADVVLANSHQWGSRLWEVFQLKRRNPDIIILHRLDGPVSVVRSNQSHLVVDKSIMSFNRRFVDGTVYQSKWSRSQCIEQGIDKKNKQVVIHNAPDPLIFYPPGKRRKSKKTRLIGVSWSINERKGFDIYKYLDDYLDFSKYSFTFIGKSPIEFHNIKHKSTMVSEKLADELRKHDLFVHASYMESCSNSLIEAMNCGLVPVAMNNTSHPEIIQQPGLFFNGKKDILTVIEQVSGKINAFRESMRPPKIEDIGQDYVDFAVQIRKQKDYLLIKPSWSDLVTVWTNWQIMNQKPRWDILFSKLAKTLHL